MRWFLVSLILVGLAGPSLAGGDKSGGKTGTSSKSVAVPYRLTDTQHVLVRVKLNGKGPFNFIVDTGAPVSFVSIPIGKKVGLEKTEKKASVLDSFEFEGGLKLNNVKIIVDTPFQLEGMNGLGVAGVELHGIIGYTELARFKMEFDFTRDKLTWTPLDFNPPPPVGIGGKGATSSLEMLGSFMKIIGGLSGMKPPEPPTPRGFLGLWFEEKKDQAVIRTILKDSPAEEAKLLAGDRIVEINGSKVEDVESARRLTAKVLPGDEVNVLIQRGSKEISAKLRAAKGL